MRKSVFLFLFLFALAGTGLAQIAVDSVPGKYTRATWTGIGWTTIEGIGEIAGYTISTTDEILQLDKNHCAALTINTEQGNYIVNFMLENPIVYYGTWKMAGDTVVITYTKKYAKSTLVFGISGNAESISKIEEPMQRKYLMDCNGSLTPLAPGDQGNYLFYKEEELM